MEVGRGGEEGAEAGEAELEAVGRQGAAVECPDYQNLHMCCNH